MSPRIKSLSFTLFADRVIDATIHPGILQNLAVIPTEWELLAKPVIRDSQVQLVFTNQVSLTKNPECIIFSELIEQEQLNTLKIPSIVANYLQVFSDIGYHSLYITAQKEISFDSETEIDIYIEQKLLLSDFWQFFENESKDELSFTFSYPYKSGKFFFKIDYNNRELFPNSKYIVYFTGSFFFPLLGSSDRQKLENLQTLMSQWRQDVNNFSEFVEQYF